MSGRVLGQRAPQHFSGPCNQRVRRQMRPGRRFQGAEREVLRLCPGLHCQQLPLVSDRCSDSRRRCCVFWCCYWYCFWHCLFPPNWLKRYVRRKSGERSRLTLPKAHLAPLPARLAPALAPLLRPPVLLAPSRLASAALVLLVSLLSSPCRYIVCLLLYTE